MSYDRVDYSDKAHFSSPSDEHQYSDEPIKFKNGSRSANGNGIYNDYTVELKPKPYSTSMKFLCFECKNTKRVKFIMVGALVVFLLALVLIIISTIAHHKQQSNKKAPPKYVLGIPLEEKTLFKPIIESSTNLSTAPLEEKTIFKPIIENSTNLSTAWRMNFDVDQSTMFPTSDMQKSPCLIAYGPDKNGLISFSPRDHMSYMDYVNRMESSLADYNTLRQAANLDKYIPCNDDTTSVPDGKVCMLTLEKFGENCQNYDLYGVMEERPCVLLVLKPDDSMTPKPFDFNGDQNAEIKKKIGNRFSDKTIAISCEGKTEKDQELLSMIENTTIIDYNPPKGFPLYYYLQRDTDGYLYPAVMVQFNTIPTQSQVNVKCTAWAKNFNNGFPQNSTKYSTEFSFLLK